MTTRKNYYVTASTKNLQSAKKKKWTSWKLFCQYCCLWQQLFGVRATQGIWQMDIVTLLIIIMNVTLMVKSINATNYNYFINHIFFGFLQQKLKINDKNRRWLLRHNMHAYPEFQLWVQWLQLYHAFPCFATHSTCAHCFTHDTNRLHFFFVFGFFFWCFCVKCN